VAMGAYRAVFAKSPTPAHPGELSVMRVVFAVASILFAVGAMLGLVYIAEVIYLHFNGRR